MRCIIMPRQPSLPGPPSPRIQCPGPPPCSSPDCSSACATCARGCCVSASWAERAIVGTAIAVVAASAAASSIRFTKELLEFGLACELLPATQSCMVAPAHRICRGGPNNPRKLAQQIGYVLCSLRLRAESDRIDFLKGEDD